MTMVTTCPACHTRFRVTPEQLDAHGGDVRCGRCAKVFNARAYLEHELEELRHEGQSKLPFEDSDQPTALPPSPPEEVLSKSSPPAPLIEEIDQDFLKPEPEEVEESLAAALAALSLKRKPVGAENLQPLQATGEHLDEPVVAEKNFVPEWGKEVSNEPPEQLESGAPEPVAPIPVESVSSEPAILAPQWVSDESPRRVAVQELLEKLEDEPKKRNFFWLWLIGTFLLLICLSVQGLYFFRSDLAARYPAAKPLLQQLCRTLRCSIPLLANPDLLSIETSHLEADPQHANLVTLIAILRSRAYLPQEYPQLELTLTDTQDQMVVRRIFTPEEYVKNTDLSRGMQPNEEVTVRLSLDLGDLKAAGYRIFLFYPHQNVGYSFS